MRFRRFTDAGVEAFRRYLHDLRADPKLPVPSGLVTDDSLTELLIPEVMAAPGTFHTRMDFARWLDHAFESADAEAPVLDTGFWAWLTAALFDEVCPADGHGKRKPGEVARFIPELSNYRLQYRHLLYGSMLIYNMYRTDLRSAYVLLATPLDQLNHFFYQLASRREVLGNPAVMLTATRLYFDHDRGRGKRGAITRGQPGTVFRYVKLLNQLDRVLDLGSVPADVLEAHLPKEFSRFRDPAPVNA